MTWQVSNSDASAAAWLRDVLMAMLDGGALPRWIEETVGRFVRRLPDRTLEAWAEALEIDVRKLRQAMPDASERLRSDAGKEAIRTHAVAYRLVPLARALHAGAKTVLKLFSSGRLAAAPNVVQRDLPALGMSRSMPEGFEIAGEVASILETTAEPDQLVGKYVAGLLQDDWERVGMVDAIIAGSGYGQQIEERLQQVRRLAGVEPPFVRVSDARRTPAWNGFWKDIWRR